jgi:1,4-dihydroxy-2-naphthoate octaprenyltransferase
MSLAQWLRLMMACLVGLVGLFLAADAGEGTLYAIGLLGFAAAVVYVFALVKRHFDRLDAGRH